MLSFPVISAAFCVVAYIVRKYRERSWGYYESETPLDDKVFLITGANSGVGKEAARQLLQRNATVIMACRNPQSIEEATKDLRKTTLSGKIVYHHLDLSSLESVRKFAAEIISIYNKIDVLINNAGLSVPMEKNQRTKEGFDINFGVNHLGHFLLTNLLLPKLKESKPSRIVIVASTLHEYGKIDFDDLNADKIRAAGRKSRFDPTYCNSKLANVYHARSLAERLEGQGVDVRVLCPGFCYTGLHRYNDIAWWKYIAFLPVAFFFMRSAWQGSQTIVYCATEPNLPGKSGDLYRDCNLYESKAKFDRNIQDRLWEVSDKLVSA